MNTEVNTTPTLDPQFAHKLRHEAMAGLINASIHEESGLCSADREVIRARVISTALGADGRPQVRIDSTGLSLDQKLFIERIVLRHLDLVEMPLAGVYFQRGSATSTTSSPAPTQKKHPFGLKIEKKQIPDVKFVLAVASGKGGVGKSTVATNLAAALVRLGFKTGLMDCDVYGPSSPQMLGVKQSVQVDGAKIVPAMGHGIKMMSFGLLSDVKTPVIWRGPMVSKAIEQLCFDVQWGPLDVLVLDLPPGTGDVQMTLAERSPLNGAVIVTTPQDVALIDAHKAVSMFEKLNIPVLGVIENMSHHLCIQCGHKDHIFGSESFDDFVRDRKLHSLGEIPLRKEIRVAGDLGKPIALEIGPLGDIYQNIAQNIAQNFASNFVSNTHNQEVH
jgi:ATP-binding protein involved in chromosome partitioning